MAKFFYALVLLAVWYGEVKGDAACFLLKTTQCSQKLAGEIQPQDHDFVLCNKRDELFACIRESAVECSVGERYNFDHLQEVYNEFCTNGSEWNLKMKKHKECIYNTIVESSSCAQDIIDFASHVKEWTPKTILELGKLSCRERTSINNCYLGFIEKKCGEEARYVFGTFIGASEDVNQEICKDILSE